MKRASLYSAIVSLGSACLDMERAGGLESEIEVINGVIEKLKQKDKDEMKKTVKVKSWLEMIKE